jgi:biopolymer transport protein ExbD
MAFHTDHYNNTGDEVMSEINMTPLVDVMLVLLIIFIVAMPIMQHAVKLDLPQASSQPQDTNMQHINIEIDKHGQVTWDKQAVTAEDLRGLASNAAAQNNEIRLHVHADKATPYEHVAQVMATVQNAGLSKIGLVTTPN